MTEFTGWSVDASGSDAVTRVYMSRDKSVTASFSVTTDPCPAREERGSPRPRRERLLPARGGLRRTC